MTEGRASPPPHLSRLPSPVEKVGPRGAGAPGERGHGKPLEEEEEDAGAGMEVAQELAAALFIHR